MNIELCSAFGFIKLTPQYTNAVFSVLVSVMGDTAQRLELPVEMPVRAEQVRGFTCDQRYREVGGALLLTNGVSMAYRNGHVMSLKVPPTYFDLQTTEIPAKYYGVSRMTTDEAVAMARNAIRRLDYTLEDTFADLNPKVEAPPVEPDGRVIPRYLIEWLDPRSGIAAATFEIDAENKRLTYASFSSWNLWRNPKRVNVPRPEPSPADPPLYQPLRSAVSLDYATALLPEILKAASKAAKSFALPFAHPVSTNDISHYRLSSEGYCAKVDLAFNNGVRMRFLGTRLVAVRQPDFFFDRTRERTHAGDFFGTWVLTDEETLALARERFNELVGQSNIFHMEQKPKSTLKPLLIGTNIAIPRVRYHWSFSDSTDDQVKADVSIEVDAEKGRVTSMSWASVSYTNDPPALDLPIEAPLPAGSGDLYLAPLGHPN